jgi:hypothetical protein
MVNHILYSAFLCCFRMKYEQIQFFAKQKEHKRKSCLIQKIISLIKKL